jgi:UDP-N-acetylglucosamine transferase subunit ALG13
VTALVLALTGTDHHAFDRMVVWIDEAAVRLPGVQFVIQHGASKPPLVATGYAHLAHDRLLELLSEASAVVCHGGPGIIMEAREAGHVPVCLPRDPKLSEHVDGHQQRFAAIVGKAGVVRTVTGIDSFHAELDGALARAAASGTAEATRVEREAARALAAAELDELLLVRPYRLARLHRARR